MLSSRLAIAVVCALTSLAFVGACDTFDAVGDRLDDALGSDHGSDPAATDPAANDVVTATGGNTGSDAASGAPAPAVPPPPAQPDPNIQVQLGVQIRSLVVGGNLYVEANFDWKALGAPGLIVDIQVKSSLSYPEWTDILTDLDAVDVATYQLQGPYQTWHFRAVAQDPANPQFTYASDIVTIQ